ncbi:putative SNF5-domain-containing protein [Lyophyllum shimeji]|uniref:SNF5-domain-containing protein n=1 Tax=Lyophyllum shimeji TaxID=47721 RepID=A0A9P3UP22_LYOSH|nr:putative SNF5-domain-containing protein [Lyophyllum shimeji]
MNNNTNGNLYQQQQQHHPSYPSGGGINPAMLAAFQAQNANKAKYPSPGGGGGGAVNPAQLMNGMGGGGGGGVGPQHQQNANNTGMGINPAQLLQQQQLFMNNNNNGMGGMGMGMPNNMMAGGSINPAALSSSSRSSPSPSTHAHAHAASSQAHPSPNPNPNPAAQSLAQLFGMTPAQFNALPPHEKQQKMMYAASQQQQATMREQFREKQLMQQRAAAAEIGRQQQQHQQQGFHPDQGMMPPQQFRGGDQGMGMNMGGMNPNANLAMGMNMGGMGGIGGGGGINSMGPSAQQQQQFRDPSILQSQSQGHSSPQPPAQMMNMNNMGMGVNNMAMGLGGGMGSGGMGMGMGTGAGMYPTQNLNPTSSNTNQDLLSGLMRAPSAMGMGGGGGGASFYDRPLSSASGSGSGAPHTPQMPHQQPGQMLPPSGIPRGAGGGGMGGIGGGMGVGVGMGTNMNMNMHFNNANSVANPSASPNPTLNTFASNMGMGVGMPGMRNVSGGAGMRPPSRAMSATPVNGVGVNGFDKLQQQQHQQTAMSPSQNLNLNTNPYGAQQQQHGQGQGQGQAVFAPPPSAHFSPGHQQQQQQRPPTPHQQQQLRTTPTPAPTSSSPPLPGSPSLSSYRGATAGTKRKVGDGSPRSAPGAGAMGPPPSAAAAANGAATSTGYSAPQTPRPPSRLSLNGAGHTPAGTTSAAAQGTGEGPSRPGTRQGQQQQQQGQGQGQGQHQRQPSLSRQGSVPAGTPKAESAPAGETPVPAPAHTAASTTAPALAAGGATPTAPGTPASVPASTTTGAAALPPPQPQVVPHLPPLPANVSLNPAVTRVTVVPLLTSLDTIPALSESEMNDVKGWMERDREYEGVFRQMKERMGREGREALWKGTAWWEKGFPGAQEGGGNRWRRAREPFDVRYPRTRREPGRDAGRGRRGVRREGLRLPRKLDEEDVNRPEQLVPIRLEFDVEHHKMRDTFVWNLNDPVVTPEHFAQTVVEDYNLSPNYHAVITKSIQDQLSDFKAHSGLYDVDAEESSLPVFTPSGTSADAGPKRGRLEGEEERWWAAWRERVNAGLAAVERSRSRSRRRGKKRRKVVKEEGEEGGDADVEDGDVDVDVAEEETGWDEPMLLEEMEIDERKMHEEMRILIKLDIIVGSMKLDDQFEWDLDSEHASPEEFAEVYATELGLNGEFKTAIAHSIREQVQTYQKSLFLVGHPSDGSAIQDEELRLSFLPSLTSAARPLDHVQSYTPVLNYLSDGEIERTEKERDKDMNKRRKRNTRGRRGIALPDREPIRTYRTPAIGFPELDPATLALAAAANAPMSRRAAAAAASLTIANMVASENGTPFLPQVAVPSAAVPPPPPKDKKTAKGHFKAPSYDPELVLRPRAKVAAPTPSTAADVSKLPAPLENDPPPPIVSSSVVMGAAAPPDSKAAKVITAKRAKELEREAKEKEFADGQHPNMIDGVWHCSNCGCPDSIAIGRRKGPLGDKSQCGICGKYWHRHRRPRPVEYNPDPDFHSGLKRELEAAKVTASQKKKGSAAALRAQSSTVPHTPAETSEPQTPSRSNGDIDVSARQSPVPMMVDDDRAISPVSTASSASEPPLAQKIKLNGSNSHRRQSTPSPPATPTLAPASTTKPDSSPNKTPVTKVAIATTSPTSPARPPGPPPPQWLASAKAAMMARYPNDKFEIIMRKVNASSSPEWRIKCLDCPGKLYTPGPGETLANYEVHLKNRQHRQRVNDRLNNGTDS